ncbi:MAG: hypothetical protein IKA82_02780 [Clostridia bacterium]|nr:hypothetical protein [Clostridia bacterium]
MVYYSKESRKDYAPLFLGNGDIAISADAEGMTEYNCYDEIKGASKRCVFRAGRRTVVNPHLKLQANLYSFGNFTFRTGAELKEFSQELVLPDGYMNSVCDYSDGSKIETTAFISQAHPIYAVKKVYYGDTKNVSYVFNYDGKVPEHANPALKSGKVLCDEKGVCFDYENVGQDIYRGRVRLLMDIPFTFADDGSSVTLSFDIKDGDTFTLYYCIEDSLFDNDHRKTCDGLAELALKRGFDGLLEESAQIFRDYFDKGYIRTENEQLNQVYLTALYHFKTVVTRWSIPVGLHSGTWEGRYFAFDEYYGMNGLLSSGRPELAKRVPEFRSNACLKPAIKRATRLTDDQARFMWETLEYGGEGAPYGFWMDHQFHMPIIALGAFEYYEYTGDIDALKKYYKMIRACAKFFTYNMIYSDGNGGFYIGKCTDLERLGSSHERAFMTTCSAISVLQVCARASEILGVDEEYRAECLALIPKLYESLPHNGERYVPYPGCPDRSIGVFSGKYPFDVLKNDDGLMLNSFEDYIANESTCGNMYHEGVKVAPWYAAWKAVGYARCGMAKEAHENLLQVFDSVGVFGDMFEINEEVIKRRPWFMTAAGVYLGAVNEMMLRGDGSYIELLPAYEGDVEFKLLAKGGATVEACIKGGEITSLKINGGREDIKVLFKGKCIGCVADFR